jgi:NAD(P)-dependent dehydrogenase (short-subunit alcohol dehydrogenase family)
MAVSVGWSSNSAGWISSWLKTRVHGQERCLVSLGRVLATQHAPDPIRCYVVFAGALEQPPDAEGVDLATREKRLTARVPLGHVGRFEEIAPMVASLASDEVSYITGSVFVADRGLTAV